MPILLPSQTEILDNSQEWLEYRNRLLSKNARRNTKKLTEPEFIEYCKKRNIKTYTEFHNITHPNNIPAAPYYYYNKGWKEIFNIIILPYHEAIKIVHPHKFKSIREYKEWHRKNKPHNLPLNPVEVYNNKGWKNNYHWLGKTTILPITEASRTIKPLKIKNTRDWLKRRLNRPQGIPSDPIIHYTKQGTWTTNQEFFGPQFKNSTRNIKKVNLPEFIKYCKKHNVTSLKSFRTIPNKPANIPLHPEREYQNKGWTGWSQITGNKRSTYFIAKNEFITLMIQLKIPNPCQYRKLQPKPPNCPCVPHKVYNCFPYELFPKSRINNRIRTRAAKP